MKTSKNTLVNDQKEAKKKLCEMQKKMHLGELQKCARSLTGVQFESQL
jgi:uncharacterized protein YggL (DUF469 family)